MRRSVLMFTLLLAASQAYSADTDQKENHLVVRHYAGRVELHNATDAIVDGKALQTDLSYSYDLRKVDSIVASIEETNPLLFTYSWKDETPTDTNDFTAAKQFAAAIKALSDLLGGFLPEAKQNIQDLSVFKDYCASARTSGIAPNDTRLCDAGLDPALLADLEGKVASLHALAAKIPDLMKTSAVSWSDALKVRDEVAADYSDVDNVVKSVRASYKKLHDVNRKLLNSASSRERAPIEVATLTIDRDTLLEIGYSSEEALVQSAGSHGTGAPIKHKPQPPQPPPTPAATLEENQRRVLTSEPLSHDVQSLFNDEKDVDIDLAALEAFVPRARKIGEPVVLKTVKYTATQVQPAVLTIAKVPLDGNPIDVGKYKTGDFKLAFNPGGPVHYEYGVGAMYSFLEVPTFDAKKGTDDKLHIARTDSGNAVSGTTGALLLTITPRNWDDPQFGMGFQLGLSPVKDKIGIFLGPRIRVYDLFTFSAGITYQQTKRLSGGQVLNDIVESADKIKMTNVFKPAAYISIGLDLKKK